MYRIGEFSKITNLSVRTLRYYNDIGLLVPEEVDILTNYRYYGKYNLKQVKIIEQLKSVGFTLDEIRDNWNNFNEELFIKRKKDLLKEIDLKEEAIKKVDELRSQINKGSLLVAPKEEKIKQKTIFKEGSGIL